MDEKNIFQEMLEMDNSLISEISGTIAELDEKLEASNGVLLEMQEHYVSLFEDTLDELADVIAQEEPVGTYLDGKEEMVSERRKLLESVSSCRSRIQSDLDKHKDMKKLMQEYEQEAKVQLAENKAMKEEIAKLEKEMGEQGLDTIKEQLNAAHASFSEEILKLKADQSDEINALEQIIEEKTKFINLQDEKIKNFMKDETIHKKNLEEERSKFQELEEKLLSSFEEKLHDREQSHDSEIKKLNMAIEDLQNSQNEELENGQERVDRLSDENDELKEQNEKILRELDDLKNNNKEPEDNVFREENENLEKEIVALRSEIQNISTASENAQAMKDLQEENEKLRSEISCLQSNNDATPAEDIQKLKDEINSLKNQILNFEDLELRKEEELFSLNEKIAKLEDADLTTQLEKDGLEERMRAKKEKIAELKEKNFDLEEKLSIYMLEETIKSEAEKEDDEEAIILENNDEPNLAMASQNVEYDKESSVLCSLIIYTMIVLIACMVIFWPELSRVARDYPETAETIKQAFQSVEESTKKTISIVLEYTPDSLVFHGQLVSQTAENIASKVQELIQFRGYEEYLDRLSDLVLEAQKRLRLA